MLKIMPTHHLEDSSLPPAHRYLLQRCWQSYTDNSDAALELEMCLVYLFPDEFDQPLTALGLDACLADLPFEGGRYHPDAHCFELIFIPNNSFSWTFIVPRTDHFNPEQLPWLAELLNSENDDAKG